MRRETRFENIETGSLADRAKNLRDSGYRLAQIGAASIGNVFEINYSFDRDYDLLNLKLTIPVEGARVPSVSHVYRAAFLYENEISDLFGIKVDNMVLDYGGNFYRMAKKTPFKNSGDSSGEGKTK